MQNTIVVVLLLIGSLFMCIGGLGILRMPDLFMRMSSATKASTLGVGFLMGAVAARFTQLEIVSRAFAIVVFVLLTAPVAAHMIGRAAYMARVPLWKGSIIDQLCDQYDRCTPELSPEQREGGDKP